MIVDTEFPKDADGYSLADTDWGIRTEKVITFDGGTANAIGDHDGTGDPFDVFTVTGTVLIRVFAVCETNIAGAATLELGIAGSTASLIAQIADATDLDAGNIWHDATPDASIELSSVLEENILANGADVIGTVGTANITAGKVRFIAIWYPLSRGAKVVAA